MYIIVWSKGLRISLYLVVEWIPVFPCRSLTIGLKTFRTFWDASSQALAPDMMFYIAQELLRWRLKVKRCSIYLISTCLQHPGVDTVSSSSLALVKSLQLSLHLVCHEVTSSLRERWVWTSRVCSGCQHIGVGGDERIHCHWLLLNNCLVSKRKKVVVRSANRVQRSAAVGISNVCIHQILSLTCRRVVERKAWIKPPVFVMKAPGYYICNPAMSEYITCCFSIPQC